MAYFLEAAHSAVSKKTHMLQVRCANPTGNFAPTQLFELRRCCGRLIFRFRTDPPSVRRCSARLIRQAETLELQPRSRPPSSHTMAFVPKRSTFSRFAACEREPRVTPQSAAAASSPLRTETPLRDIPVFRSAYFPKKLFSFFSKTLDLQVRSAHPPNCTCPVAALNLCTIQDRVSPPRKVSGSPQAA